MRFEDVCPNEIFLSLLQIAVMGYKMLLRTEEDIDLQTNFIAIVYNQNGQDSL